jgi:ribosome-binding protein aMBF1 (putative translation factor)
MKVCESCGREIGTRDGDNMCRPCEDKEGRITKKAKSTKKEREDIMIFMGLTKVKGALGGTYWE